MKLSSFEIVSNIYCLQVAPTENFSYNSFLIIDERTTLIHTGRAKYFRHTLELARKYIEVEKIAFIAFSHFEADECGALNEWLEVSPNAVPLIGAIGLASIDDISSKPPVCIHDGQILSLGKYALQVLETPHCPHGWDACLFFEPTTKILFSSDIGAQPGNKPVITEDDISQEIVEFQRQFGFLSEGTDFIKSLDRIISLSINILATQHGSLISGPSAHKILNALKQNALDASGDCLDRKRITCNDF